MIVPYVHKLSYRLQFFTGDADVTFLRAVHELSNESMMNVLKESQRIYRPYKVVTGTEADMKEATSTTKQRKRRKSGH